MKKVIYIIGAIVLILFVIGILSDTRESRDDSGLEKITDEVLGLMQSGDEDVSESKERDSEPVSKEEKEIGVTRDDLEKLKADIEGLQVDDLSSFSQ